MHNEYMVLITKLFVMCLAGRREKANIKSKKSEKGQGTKRDNVVEQANITPSHASARPG